MSAEESTSAQVTMEELLELEYAEYKEACRKLLLDANFHRFLVQWMVATDVNRTTAVEPGQLNQYNWDLARASLVNEFLEGVRTESPNDYRSIMQGREEYERRRRDADKRVERDSEYND